MEALPGGSLYQAVEAGGEGVLGDTRMDIREGDMRGTCVTHGWIH